MPKGEDSLRRELILTSKRIVVDLESILGHQRWLSDRSLGQRMPSRDRKVVTVVPLKTASECR